MKKGLTLALTAVVMAVFSYNVMAEAPVIKNIPDIVVGNEGGITDATLFVYPDAVALDQWATDDELASGDLIWSYESAGRYSFNGVDPLAGTDDPVAPGAKSINDQVLNGEVDEDATANTVTVRNTELSPITGDRTAPGFTGVEASEVVTLWVSDGVKASSKSIIVFTDNGGWDRLSPMPGNGEVIVDINDFTDAPFTQKDIIGSATASISNGNICLFTPVAPAGGADHLATWESDYGFVDLVKNSVYLVRATVTSGNTEPGTVPLWDMFLWNFNDATGGPNAYGNDYFYLDNAGSANAAASYGRSSFETLWAPLPLRTNQWNDETGGPFGPSFAAEKDMKFAFRVINGDEGIVASNDSGTICMEDLVITRYEYDDLTQGAAVYSATDLSSSNLQVHNRLPGADNVNATYTGGNLVINPASGAWEAGDGVEFVAVEPGDGVFNTNTGDGVADDWPITWESDTYYQVTVNISASSQLGVTNPPDVLMLGYDAPTFEIVGNSWVTGSMDQAALPKLTAQPYTLFFYSHTSSTSEIPNHNRLRSYVEILSADEYVFDAVVDSTGGYTVHDMIVEKVELP